MWPVLQFVLADASAEPDFQPAGVVIICGALLADAFVGNTQESLMAYVGVGSHYVRVCCVCFRRTLGSLQWYMQVPHTPALCRCRHGATELETVTWTSMVSAMIGVAAMVLADDVFLAVGCVAWRRCGTGQLGALVSVHVSRPCSSLFGLAGGR